MHRTYAGKATVFSVLVALFAAGILTVPADAHGRVRNGRITFMRRDENGLFQTWVANADMTGQVRLTSGPSASGWSSWAPGGRRIGFDSTLSDPDLTDDIEIYDVFTMKPDGSDVRQLTDNKAGSGNMSYSSDGRSITFDYVDVATFPDDQGIYVMEADGSNQRPLTAHIDPVLDTQPQFSPDGREIVFTRYRLDDPPENQWLSAVMIVKSDGSGLRQITGWDLYPGNVNWSPDGKWITFETEVPPGDLYIVRADGSRLTNITHHGEQDQASDPVWAPDGKTILYLRGVVTDESTVVGLATIKPNGKNRKFISDAPQEEHQPDWEAVTGRHRGHGGSAVPVPHATAPKDASGLDATGDCRGGPCTCPQVQPDASDEVRLLAKVRCLRH